jgi:peptide/nickel transport system permease protein
MKLFRRKITLYTSGSLTREAWRKLIRNRLSFVALLYILLSVIVAILGYLITPDSTPMANSQYLELGAKPPGFSVIMSKQLKEDTVKQKGFLHKMIFGARSNYSYIPIQDTDSLYNNDANTIKMRFMLGTDQYGRDLLSRLMIGSRVSLAVGFISVIISLLIGITIGAAGGYFRGRIDKFVVWLINVVWSVPTLLLVIAITFSLGKGFWQVFVAVGFTMWVEVARVTRGQILAIREKEYVEAARALGFSDFRIIFRHILPNAAGPIIVISAANFASAILIEAGLSFLGIGVQPPMPSWGSMIRENYAYLILDASHLAILPGLAIMLIVLAFMILGNGLRDALDVKTHTSVLG